MQTATKHIKNGSRIRIYSFSLKISDKYRSFFVMIILLLLLKKKILASKKNMLIKKKIYCF